MKHEHDIYQQIADLRAQSELNRARFFNRETALVLSLAAILMVAATYIGA